ncbi:hypothetical protein [Sagittula sp. S175]|uniref:hypothetical protein n=1 Tax=Sagittula sp. S175 TaxID=3415129 RepID=UPI003C7D6419
MTAKKPATAPEARPVPRSLPQSGGSYTVSDKGKLTQTATPTQPAARPAPAKKEA